MRAALLLVPLALGAPGDRVYARPGAVLHAAPADASPAVRALLSGDELVELDPPEDDFGNPRPIRGFCRVQTVDVPSGRSFMGFAADRDLTTDPPAEARRIAILHSALEREVAELEAREKPFGDLRDQLLAWRDRAAKDPTARAEVQRLADRLAAYMEAEVTPRAFDVQDQLAELRDLQDPRRGLLAARFDRAAAAFRP